MKHILIGLAVGVLVFGSAASLAVASHPCLPSETAAQCNHDRNIQPIPIPVPTGISNIDQFQWFISQLLLLIQQLQAQLAALQNAGGVGATCAKAADCKAGLVCMASSKTCQIAPPPPTGCYCNEMYDPVCGVDGKTYSNACFAGCAKVTVAYKGACNAQANTQYNCHVPCTGMVPSPEVSRACSSFITAAQCGQYQSNEFPFRCEWGKVGEVCMAP